MDDLFALVPRPVIRDICLLSRRFLPDMAIRVESDPPGAEPQERRLTDPIDSSLPGLPHLDRDAAELSQPSPLPGSGDTP